MSSQAAEADERRTAEGIRQKLQEEEAAVRAESRAQRVERLTEREKGASAMLAATRAKAAADQKQLAAWADERHKRRERELALLREEESLQARLRGVHVHTSASVIPLHAAVHVHASVSTTSLQLREGGVFVRGPPHQASRLFAVHPQALESQSDHRVAEVLRDAQAEAHLQTLKSELHSRLQTLERDDRAHRMQWQVRSSVESA